MYLFKKKEYSSFSIIMPKLSEVDRVKVATHLQLIGNVSFVARQFRVTRDTVRRTRDMAA